MWPHSVSMCMCVTLSHRGVCGCWVQKPVILWVITDVWSDCGYIVSVWQCITCNGQEPWKGQFIRRTLGPKAFHLSLLAQGLVLVAACAGLFWRLLVYCADEAVVRHTACDPDPAGTRSCTCRIMSRCVFSTWSSSDSISKHYSYRVE